MKLASLINVFSSVMVICAIGCVLMIDGRDNYLSQIGFDAHRAYLCESGTIPLRTRSILIEKKDFDILESILRNRVRQNGRSDNVRGTIGKCYYISSRNPNNQCINKLTFSEYGVLCDNYEMPDKEDAAIIRAIIQKYISRLNENDDTSSIVGSKLEVRPTVYDFKCIDTNVWSRAFFTGYVINNGEADVAIRSISNANPAVHLWVSSSNICHNSCIGIELGIDMKRVTNSFSGSIGFITDLPGTNEFRINYQGSVIDSR